MYSQRYSRWCNIQRARTFSEVCENTNTGVQLKGNMMLFFNQHDMNIWWNSKWFFKTFFVTNLWKIKKTLLSKKILFINTFAHRTSEQKSPNFAGSSFQIWHSLCSILWVQFKTEYLWKNSILKTFRMYFLFFAIKKFKLFTFKLWFWRILLK